MAELSSTPAADVRELPTAVRFEHPAWEQQSYETDPAFMAAEIYFRQGRARTVQAAWDEYREKKVGKGRKRSGRNDPPGAFRQWRMDNHWDARARLYDEHEDNVKRRKHEEALEQLAEEQAQDLRSARIAISTVALSIRRELADPAKREQFYARLDAMDILDRIRVAGSLARGMKPLVEAERTVRGVPDEETLAALRAATEGAVPEHADRDPIAEILDDPDRTTAAAWSVLPSRRDSTSAS